MYYVKLCLDSSFTLYFFVNEFSFDQVNHTLDLKGYNGIIQLMRVNLDNEFVLWRATRALRDLVQENEDVRADVVKVRNIKPYVFVK